MSRPPRGIRRLADPRRARRPAARRGAARVGLRRMPAAAGAFDALTAIDLERQSSRRSAVAAGRGRPAPRLVPATGGGNRGPAWPSPPESSRAERSCARLTIPTSPSQRRRSPRACWAARAVRRHPQPRARLQAPRRRPRPARRPRRRTLWPRDAESNDGWRSAARDTGVPVVTPRPIATPSPRPTAAATPRADASAHTRRHAGADTGAQRRCRRRHRCPSAPTLRRQRR